MDLMLKFESFLNRTKLFAEMSDEELFQELHTQSGEYAENAKNELSKREYPNEILEEISVWGTFRHL